MERLLIYGLAVANIVLGFVIYYRKPSPFEKRRYDK